MSAPEFSGFFKRHAFAALQRRVRLGNEGLDPRKIIACALLLKDRVVNELPGGVFKRDSLVPRNLGREERFLFGRQGQSQSARHGANLSRRSSGFLRVGIMPQAREPFQGCFVRSKISILNEMPLLRNGVRRFEAICLVSSIVVGDVDLDAGALIEGGAGSVNLDEMIVGPRTERIAWDSAQSVTNEPEPPQSGYDGRWAGTRAFDPLLPPGLLRTMILIG
jgi:hypothetical protein